MSDTMSQPHAARTLAVTLRVNGEAHRVVIPAQTTLLDALRERMGLTGTKKGRERCECGACTVDIDGRRALGRVREAPIAFGGMAHKPWRLLLAEQSLRGAPLERTALRTAIESTFAEVRLRRHSGFKVELAKRAVERAIETAATMSDA